MQLHGHLGAMEAKGARMHLIGNGGPSFIAGFREATDYAGTIYTDPGLKTYEAAGLLRSVRATLGLRSIKAGVKSLARGERQGTTQGDPWQQGGALVISAEGELLFRHQSQAGGDNVAASQLLRALS